MAWTRWDRPEIGNPYYNNKSSEFPGYSTCITGSPTEYGLNVLCNCTGLANGCFNETYVINAKVSPKQYFAFHTNANRFIEIAPRLGCKVLTPDAYPPLGGMIVWGGTANHVAYISEVIDRDHIKTIESGWNTPSWVWHQNKNRARNDGYGSTPSAPNQWGFAGTCLGFVVNPAIGEGPIDPDPPPEVSCINICINGTFKEAIPYLYSNGAWHEVEMNLYSNGAWHK